MPNLVLNAHCGGQIGLPTNFQARVAEVAKCFEGGFHRVLAYGFNRLLNDCAVNETTGARVKQLGVFRSIFAGMAGKVKDNRYGKAKALDLSEREKVAIASVIADTMRDAKEYRKHRAKGLSSKLTEKAKNSYWLTVLTQPAYVGYLNEADNIIKMREEAAKEIADEVEIPV